MGHYPSRDQPGDSAGLAQHARRSFPGSGRVSRRAMFIFGGCLLLPITIFFTIIFFVLVRPEWRANHNYIEHRCTVLDKRMGVNRGDESTTYRPEIYVRYS
jgi:hypothetical protein